MNDTDFFWLFAGLGVGWALWQLVGRRKKNDKPSVIAVLWRDRVNRVMLVIIAVIILGSVGAVVYNGC